ncbi:MAG: hypothetical protein KJN63_02300 [Acidimicrobiia bacterium]|nr:hypothetical protein [Acidimicrobiia bacterium]
MSDVFQGAGWWMASDGKWYAPQLHHDPAYRAKYAASPPEEPEPEPEVDLPEAVDSPEAIDWPEAEAEDDPREADLEPDVDGGAEKTDESGWRHDAEEPGAKMPPPVVKPVEPIFDENTATIVAQAAPPPEIRWPDLPGADETTSFEPKEADDGAKHEGDAAPPTEVERSDDDVEEEDEGWVSHQQPEAEKAGRVSITPPAAAAKSDRPIFEPTRPPSVGDAEHPGSRARLEVGRAPLEAEPVAQRAPSSTVSFESRPHRPLSTASNGLSEIRVYKEPADVIDRVIAAVLFSSGLAMIVGTFINWVREAGGDTTGWDRGDGLATVLAGVLGAAAAGPIFVGFRHIIPKTVAIVCGLVGAVVVGLVGLDVVSDTATAGTSLGAGFWVVLVGALAMIVAGAAERTSIR